MKFRVSYFLKDLTWMVNLKKGHQLPKENGTVHVSVVVLLKMNNL